MQAMDYSTFFLLLFSGFLLSCDSENAPDCLQSAGDLVRTEVSTAPFTQVTVFEKVALVVRQGAEQKVEIETGKNLLNEVSAEVMGDRLVLRNQNGCNLFRQYGLTTVYVTSPNITEIRSSTGLSIKSDGVLAYQSLVLLSESFADPETQTTDGSFDLQVEAQDLRVVTNGIAYFRLRGTAENLNVTVAAGDSRIEAQDLVARQVVFDHRGSNDLLVDPRESLNGTLRGTGDVIGHYRPPEIDVRERYRGRLRFVE